jgi:hypothetical protein
MLNKTLGKERALTESSSHLTLPHKTLGKERALTESSSHLTLPHKTLGKERALMESSSHLTLPHTILEQGFQFSKQNKCSIFLKFPAFSFAFSHDTYYVSQNFKIQAGL